MIGANRDPRFAVGMIADWRGQQYELIGIEQRQRRDGRETMILVWRTQCLGCGAQFETTTPQRNLRYPSRRCPVHTRKRAS
jgi:hypothetical protein